MEPIATTCPGDTCDRYRGRLVRGMCKSHYNEWAAQTPQDKRPPRPRAVGCQIEGCDTQRIQARGMCTKHYARWKFHGDPLWQPSAPREGCSVPGCEGEHKSLGYCVTHYSRLHRRGDVNASPRFYAGPVCEVDDCDTETTRGRYCGKHRGRLTRLGTTDLQPRDRYTHSQGYQLVKRPDHPVARDTGWAFEHRVVLFDAIGPGWHPCHHCGMQVSWELTYPEHLDALVVDHLDEDKANNAPDNLVPSCSPCNFARSSRWESRRRKRTVG